MNFFAGNRKKRISAKDRYRRPDLEILNRAVYYAENLVLPERQGAVSVQTAAVQGDTGACLLFFADGTEAGSMNAGYLVGQSASFLQFQGMEAVLMRAMPEGVCSAAPSGQQFIAALLVEEKDQGKVCEKRYTTGFGYRKDAEQWKTESPCICTERRENWSDELLDFTKARYPKTFRRIRASRKESWIHFAMKRTGRRHAAEDAFEAGMAAANIMTAAEELWVDLEMVKIGAAAPEGYLFSVCRKGDRRISYA